MQLHGGLEVTPWFLVLCTWIVPWFARHSPELHGSGTKITKQRHET